MCVAHLVAFACCLLRLSLFMDLYMSVYMYSTYMLPAQIESVHGFMYECIYV